MKRIAVIGAGPAGLIAAAFAKTPETSVTLIDRNEKAGKKLFLTGKGRCNITNVAPRDEFMLNIPINPRFLYSAFDNFFNDDIIELIESQGVRTKVERGGRVFPQSDKSSDVIKALVSFAQKRGVSCAGTASESGESKRDARGGLRRHAVFCDPRAVRRAVQRHADRIRRTARSVYASKRLHRRRPLYRSRRALSAHRHGQDGCV